INKEQSDAQAEIRRLQKELKRVTDERDILKKAAAYFAKLSDCCGQLKLATALEFFQYRFSDSFGGNPPLYSCGLSAL
ncbi:hypothetical protein QM105_24225, partial [Leclercia adecarboxylata]|nr:hypothetical protein [Leclercia adecarboxylata]